MIDERAQEPRVRGASDQTSLLGEFADHRVREGFPRFHTSAGRFEGAAVVPARQDALFAQQDRSDADAGGRADGRVGGGWSGAAGTAGEAGRPVWQAPGADEFGNMTQSQITQEVGISQVHVSRALAQLREKLLVGE